MKVKPFISISVYYLKVNNSDQQLIWQMEMGMKEQNLNIKWHRLFETREPLHRVPHQDDDISFLRGI